MHKTAIIIKGNPKLIEGNEKAEIFYKNLEAFIRELGFEAEFDPGEPFTTPKIADLWIGHSRGADRLRFAEQKTKVIGIGVPEPTEKLGFPVVNHPDDPMVKVKYKEGEAISEIEKNIDDTNHYVLTPEMKGEIINIIEPKEEAQ